MCAWPRRGRGVRSRGEEGPGWGWGWGRATEGAGGARARGAARPGRSCRRGRSCPGGIAQTPTDRQLTLGSRAPPGMGAQLFSDRALSASGAVLTGVDHPCLAPSRGWGAPPSVAGRGRGGTCGTRERAAHGGLGPESKRPRATLGHRGLWDPAGLQGEMRGPEKHSRGSPFPCSHTPPLVGTLDTRPFSPLSPLSNVWTPI